MKKMKLSLPKGMVNNIKKSGDADFLALLELNGTEMNVEMPVVQAAISKKHLRVNFKTPFVGNLPIGCFKEVA